ncbi:LysR family transcriptional regulator [Catenulispora sp. NL8]|uniref:LysR family transcriptional regulator n=1 Tax=Catenulispora pinistramenti TaxID=2705254 RepID=A0ABS5KHH0_9ACTN|nr:LysR family transcriptional regulator [Catenulispora pinistramenti]
METRELAYFLAVADELHFGRAAARLGIAQPALSKTIQRLERRLDASLFVRTSRTVTLTAAGQVLARDARAVLAALSAATARTQRTDAGHRRLVLAMRPGGDAGLLPAILAAYDREPDVPPIEVVFAADQARLLREGKADAALLYLPPADLRGLDSETLASETSASETSVSDALLSNTDAPPPHPLVLAWPAHRTSPAVAALTRAAVTAVTAVAAPDLGAPR